MGILSRKGDPVAEAQADVDKLGAQRGKLVTRLSDLSSRLEQARAARRDALVAGDLDDATMAAVDKVFTDATEARTFVEEEITAVTAKLDEAQRHLDGLQEGVRRAEIAADAERRAVALDEAAEALAGAAEAFRDARTAMAQAIGEHGIRIENVLMAGGSAPAALLAKPIVMAAVRLAAPGVLPVANGFGDPHVDDPLIAMRRAQSGRLRDHADDIRDGRTPAVEMPRPGSTAPDVQPPGSRGLVSLAPAGLSLSEPMTRTVFAVPFLYMSTGDRATLQGEPGDSLARLIQPGSSRLDGFSRNATDRRVDKRHLRRGGRRRDRAGLGRCGRLRDGFDGGAWRAPSLTSPIAGFGRERGAGWPGPARRSADGRGSVSSSRRRGRRS